MNALDAQRTVHPAELAEPAEQSDDELLLLARELASRIEQRARTERRFRYAAALALNIVDFIVAAR